METDADQNFTPLEQVSRPTVPTDGLVHPSIPSPGNVQSTEEEGCTRASGCALPSGSPPFPMLDKGGRNSSDLVSLEGEKERKENIPCLVDLIPEKSSVGMPSVEISAKPKRPWTKKHRKAKRLLGDLLLYWQRLGLQRHFLTLNAYDKALRALLPDSREWWEQYVEEEEYQATAEGLGDFISEHLEPLCMGMEKTARHHEAIKAQALGEGLQAHRLEKLNRYETHLDRKFERTLAMLLKLKQLRG